MNYPIEKLDSLIESLEWAIKFAQSKSPSPTTEIGKLHSHIGYLERVKKNTLEDPCSTCDYWTWVEKEDRGNGEWDGESLRTRDPALVGFSVQKKLTYVIPCPDCSHKNILSHLKWTAIRCEKCGSQIDRNGDSNG